MKKTVSVACILFLQIWYSMAQDGYIINGNIEGINSGKVTLLKMDSQLAASPFNFKPVSTELINGEFQFKGSVKYPIEAVISVGSRSFSIFLENSEIKINSKYADLNWEFLFTGVSGSKSNNEYKMYLDEERIFNQYILKLDTLLTQAKERGDTLLAKKIVYEFKANKFYSLKYLMENHDSYVSAYILDKEYHKYSRSELIEIIKKFDKVYYESHYIQNILKNEGIEWELID